MSTVSRDCDTCGKPLAGLQVRFCSVACTNQNRPRTSVSKPKDQRPTHCAQCAEPIPEYRRRYGAVAYCSVGCNAAAHTKRVMARRRAAGLQRLATGKACALCSRVFVARTGQQIYCSVFCRLEVTNAAKRAADKLARAEERAARRGSSPNCQTCGVDLASVGPLKRKFCSERCGWRWRDKQRSRAGAAVKRDRPKPVAAVVFQAPDREPTARPVLPCHGCAWGRSSAVSETGVECAREAVGRCRPWVAASLFEARREEA